MISRHEIHLRDYISVIKKRRHTIVAFFLLTFTTVLIGTLVSQPIYEASTKILVEKDDTAPLLGGYYRGRYEPEFVETQIQLIESINVAKRVVKNLSLENTYDFYFPKDEKKTWLSAIGQLPYWFKEQLVGILKLIGIETNKGKSSKEKSKTNSIAQLIKSKIIVKPIKTSKLLNISFESKNPAFAHLVANEIATAYIEELMAIQLNSSGHAISWMTQKMEEEKAKLAKSEKALQKFMKDKDIVTIEDRITITPQKLSDYTAQLSNAESERKEIETIYKQVVKEQKNRGDLDSIPALASERSLQTLRQQIRETEKQILEYSQKFGDKHPIMKNTKGELRNLKQKKNQEIDKLIKAIKHKYELAKSKEDYLRNSLNETKEEAITLREKFIQYGILKREVEANQALYKALSMRIKEKGVAEDTQNVNVWITEAAEKPEHPVRPKKILNILLGMVMGAIGGTGLAFFLEYLDNTIKEPDEAEAKTDLNTLGVVPSFSPEWGKDIEIAQYQKPSSPFAESFKAIRSSVLLSAADAPPKHLLITSMAPQEGKSTITVNLAIAIAQANYKVLLIDADMRRPRIHKIFNVHNSKGLSSYLAGAGDEDIVQTIAKSKLNIIPSGPIPPNPSELLASNRLKELLKKFREEFDFIIFDSPPILGATDSVIISKVIDGTIIVTRAEKTTYDMIRQGVKSLTNINANILGMVINDMNLKESRYHYYYGYYSEDSKKNAP